MIQSFRHWLFQVLEQHGNGLGLMAHLINLSLMLLILLNVISIIISSEVEIHQRYLPFFELFEVFSLMIFTLEYFARVWISIEHDDRRRSHYIKARLRYMLTPMALIDLLAIVPSYFMVIFGTDLLMLRALRLVRVFKLTRYSRSMELLVTVAKQEAENMISAIFILWILIIIAATGIFLLEGHIQPKEFGSIPRALWWATVTLTTVGYGDVVPVTVMGKIFGIVIVILGIGMAALPAGILASGFTSEINRRRERFKLKIMSWLRDGDSSMQLKKQRLNQLRLELGIGRQDASVMILEARNEMKTASHIDCPHCGNSIHIHHSHGNVHLEKRKK